MKRVFIDSNDARQPIWMSIGFEGFDWTVTVVPGPCFALLHAKDVGESVGDDDARVPFGRSPGDLEDWIRRHWGQRTAILYFSGGGDPWLALNTAAGRTRRAARAFPPPDSTFTGLCSEIFEPNSEEIAALAARLDRLIRWWEEAGCADPPDWTLLKRDWLWDAVDFLLGESLRVSAPDADESSRAARRLFSGAEFESTLSRLAIGTDGRSVLSEIPNRLRCEGDARTQVLRDALAVLRRGPGADFAPEVRGGELEAERARLSHTLFQNDFVGCLGPGWNGDDRGTDRDLVFMAAKGDVRSGEEFQAIVQLWIARGAPALRDLVTSVSSTEIGRLLTWQDEVVRVTAAADTIERLFGEWSARPSSNPGEQSHAFWDACEALASFLHDIPKRWPEFYRY